MQTQTARYRFYPAHQQSNFETNATLSRLQSNHDPSALPKVEEVSMTCGKQLCTIPSNEDVKTSPLPGTRPSETMQSKGNAAWRKVTSQVIIIKTVYETGYPQLWVNHITEAIHLVTYYIVMEIQFSVFGFGKDFLMRTISKVFSGFVAKSHLWHVLVFGPQVGGTLAPDPWEAGSSPLDG